MLEFIYFSRSNPILPVRDRFNLLLFSESTEIGYNRTLDHSAHQTREALDQEPAWSGGFYLTQLLNITAASSHISIEWEELHVQSVYIFQASPTTRITPFPQVRSEQIGKDLLLPEIGPVDPNNIFVTM